MMLLAASQRIFFSQGQRRIWVVFVAPEVLEEEKVEDEEETQEESHRTHPNEAEDPELAMREPSLLDLTRLLAHPKALETDDEKWQDAGHP